MIIKKIIKKYLLKSNLTEQKKNYIYYSIFCKSFKIYLIIKTFGESLCNFDSLVICAQFTSQKSKNRIRYKTDP